jgi:malate dehydrogenase (oxaloacetate-decarboxylating)
MLGAGASNTAIARFIIAAGGDPGKIILFDSKGSLSVNRDDIKNDPRFYRKWELCQSTNRDKINDFKEACMGADVLLALSKPGPDVIKPECISAMADKAIVFVCANPIPEIYPYAAKQAGAYIVATGRGDFPNQVNNSLGFPGILKGALMVRAKKVTDTMAIAASYSLARHAEKLGINPEYIIPTMDDVNVFPEEAADVAIQAIKDGVARIELSHEDAFKKAKADIEYSRSLTKILTNEGFIQNPTDELIQEAIVQTIREIQ